MLFETSRLTIEQLFMYKLETNEQLSIMAGLMYVLTIEILMKQELMLQACIENTFVELAF